MSHRSIPPKKSPQPELRKDPAPKAVSRAELEALRQKTVDLISAKPDKAALILAEWMGKAVSSQFKPKKAG